MVFKQSACRKTLSACARACPQRRTRSLRWLPSPSRSSCRAHMHEGIARIRVGDDGRHGANGLPASRVENRIGDARLLLAPKRREVLGKQWRKIGCFIEINYRIPVLIAIELMNVDLLVRYRSVPERVDGTCGGGVFDRRRHARIVAGDFDALIDGGGPPKLAYFEMDDFAFRRSARPDQVFVVGVARANAVRRQRVPDALRCWRRRPGCFEVCQPQCCERQAQEDDAIRATRRDQRFEQELLL